MALFAWIAITEGTLGNKEEPAKAPGAVAAKVASVPDQRATTRAPSRSKNVDLLGEILSQRRLRIGVMAGQKPFLWIDKDGRPTGFNFEFLNLMLKQKPFSEQPLIPVVVAKSVDSYEAVPAILDAVDANGFPAVDMVLDGLTFPDHDPSNPRAIYSVPYVSDFGFALIAPKDSPIKNMAGLQGKRVGFLKGSSSVEKILSDSGVQLTAVPVQDQAGTPWIVDSFQKQKLDAFIYDYPFAVNEIAGSRMRFVLPFLEGSNLAYKIGIHDSQPKLMEAVNKAIIAARETDEYKNLLRKYFRSALITAVDVQANDQVYIVKRGDTLSSIASHLFGKGSAWGELQSKNKLPNPNLVEVGQKIYYKKAR